MTDTDKLLAALYANQSKNTDGQDADKRVYRDKRINIKVSQDLEETYDKVKEHMELSSGVVLKHTEVFKQLLDFYIDVVVLHDRSEREVNRLLIRGQRAPELAALSRDVKINERLLATIIQHIGIVPIGVDDPSEIEIANAVMDYIQSTQNGSATGYILDGVGNKVDEDDRYRR